MPEPTPPPAPNTPPPAPQGPGNKPQKPGMPPLRSMAPWWLLVILICVVGFAITKWSPEIEVKVEYSRFMEYAKQKEFKGAIKVQDNKVLGKTEDLALAKKILDEANPGSVFDKSLKSLSVYAEVRPGDALVHWQIQQLGVPYEFDNQRNMSLFFSILINLLFPVLLIGGLIYMSYRSMRGGGGGPGGFLGGFNRSKHKIMGKDQSRVRLGDVAGVEEAKDEVGEIISFLKDPKKFQRLGGRVPRGVLLSGSPGCGKTLLAKAVAGEADVPFFSLSGSDFVEMFVGVGASRVRDLFKQAKEMSPCIIFLDEIDAVGRKRGSGMSGGHDERDQTLNAILVEMDGFESSDQVIVIAATNRVDVLDPALTRPGRFDRTITVPLPDVKGRMEILKVHAKKVKFSPVIQWETIARGTPGFSGAELEALINEAAIMATLQNKDFVEQVDLEEARDKVRWGRAKKSRKVEEQERILVAYHEAGHTIVSMFSPEADPLHKVTIIPRGDYGGAMFSLPKDDRAMLGRKKCLAAMRVACGGRIAEERKCGDISNGASSDIQKVTAYARHMVKNWGMSDALGFVSWESEERGGFVPETTYSDETGQKIDAAVRQLVDNAYREAKQLLDEHWDQLERLAQALLKHETLTAEECQQIIDGQELGKATIAELLDIEAKKMEQPPAMPEVSAPVDPAAPGSPPQG